MELDIDTILKAAGSDSVGKNADSIFGMLTELNKVLSELDKVLAFAKKLEGNILVSTVVRMKAKESGIELKALSPENSIIPQTDMHRQVLNNINNLSTEKLTEFIHALGEYDKKKIGENGK
jgi:hypothetical protein